MNRSLPWRAATSVVLAVALLVTSSSVARASGFPDVSVGHPFGVPIAWAVDERVTAGFGDGTFRPTESVSRQALAAFLYRADGTGVAQPACESGAPFGDVPVDHPFCGYIEWLVDEGLATGFDDGTFRPTLPISRQAMAAFLARAELGGLEPRCEGAAPFGDVPAGHPFCGYIEWLVDEGLATGFDDGTFRPTLSISRQAAATFLWRQAGQPTGSTTRTTVAEDGSEPLVDILGAAISGDGNTVAFHYRGDQLVPSLSGEVAHLVVRDLDSGVISSVSEAIGGGEPDAGVGTQVGLSHDGQVVAFVSSASNLVPGTTNDERDVFVHDRTTGSTERVSVASDGSEADGVGLSVLLSGDGRFIAFESASSLLAPGITNDVADVFVHDRVTGDTERISVSGGGVEANDHSWPDGISADGRYVSFTSMATNLVTAEVGDGSQVYVHDRVLGTTELVSVSSDGEAAAGDHWNQGAGVADDGRIVLFQSRADNLVSADTEGRTHVYAHDRLTGTTELVSVTPDGVPVSSDALVGVGSLSADGRWVVFGSTAHDVVPGISNDLPDVFVRDRLAGTTERVSLSSAGDETSGGTASGRGISQDGSRVLFSSSAPNLTPGITNDVVDLFVRTRYGVR